MRTKSEFDIAMEEFLANGGEVKQIARGVQSETATTNFWGAPKKKSAVEAVNELSGVSTIDTTSDSDV
jgi:hypothetical protein